jgi:hypothetical protein
MRFRAQQSLRTPTAPSAELFLLENYNWENIKQETSKFCFLHKGWTLLLSYEMWGVSGAPV